MAKADAITFCEFLIINGKLKSVSDTWSDLWVLTYLLKVRIGWVIPLKYNDVIGGVIRVDRGGNINPIDLPLKDNIKDIIQRRRELYFDDIYIFQSHSNRVKAKVAPVTIIAFNQAIRDASQKVAIKKNVSSNSARRVIGSGTI